MTKIEEYIKRIPERAAAALEAGDFEEQIKIRYEIQYAFLAESYFKEIRGPYFPSLWPELSKPSDKSYKKALDRLQQLESGSIVLFMEPYDKEAIKEITDYNPISLFEVALLIGYRVDNDPRSIINDCLELFTDAIVNSLIDPRDPSTSIPYRKLHKSLHFNGEKMVVARKIPTLSWKLTLKEAAEFAILKGYPEHLFTDLLSDAPTNDVSQPSHKEHCGSDTFQQKNDVKTDGNSTDTKPVVNSIEWKINARKIGQRISCENPLWSINQIAQKTHKEMKNRLHESGMTGRGGKVPNAETIKRHALTGIKS